MGPGQCHSTVLSDEEEVLIAVFRGRNPCRGLSVLLRAQLLLRQGRGLLCPLPCHLVHLRKGTQAHAAVTS